MPEENYRNPTIAVVTKRESPNHFIIRYRTDEIRKKYAEMIMHIIRKHEVTNFHVEEKKAFMRNRILYNMKTIGSGENITPFELEKEFVKYFEN